MTSSLPSALQTAFGLDPAAADRHRERLASRIARYRDRLSPNAVRGTAARSHSFELDFTDGVPVIPAERLTGDILDFAIGRHGSLIVRDLLPEPAPRELGHIIDQVLDASARAITEGGDSVPRGPFHNPPEILGEVMTPMELGYSRHFHHDSGSAMCVEAPSVAEGLLDLYRQLGLHRVIADYLRDTPCVSAKKWVLRKTILPISEAGWHQDGSFMGTDINSLNLWMPLTHCGGTTGAPGLDVVPRRLDSIVSARDALFDWSVAPATIAKEFPDSPPVSPEFFPGDAYFFDHFFLHRTQYGEHLDRARHAIETWFFGNGSYPGNQVPMAW